MWGEGMGGEGMCKARMWRRETGKRKEKPKANI